MNDNMSENTTWKGAYAYIPTPANADGDVDERALEALVDRCIADGIQGLTPLGSSGELPLLTSEQRARVIAKTVEAANGRVPVIGGVGGFDTRSMVADAKRAAADGCDGVLLVPLAYYPLRDAEVLSVIEAVAEAVDVPVVLYNHPDVTGVDLSDEVIRRAVEEFGIRYAKDASGQITRVSRWIRVTDGALNVFSATAVSPTAAMLLGAVGWMSGPAALLAKESREIYELASAGRWAEAVEAENRLNPALAVFRKLGPGRGIKALFEAAGQSVGQPFRPLAPITEDELAWVKGQLVGLRG